MGADWFIADPDEAADVASIVCQIRRFEDWPHLDLADLGDEAIEVLWGLLRADDSAVAAELLFEDVDPEDGSVAVWRVHPGLVRALAGMQPTDLRPLARRWVAADALADWNALGAEAALKRMAAFARRTMEEGKAVLAMAVA